MGNVQSATNAFEVFRHPASRGELLDLGRVLREPWRCRGCTARPSGC